MRKEFYLILMVLTHKVSPQANRLLFGVGLIGFQQSKLNDTIYEGSV